MKIKAEDARVESEERRAQMEIEAFRVEDVLDKLITVSRDGFMETIVLEDKTIKLQYHALEELLKMGFRAKIDLNEGKGLENFLLVSWEFPSVASKAFELHQRTQRVRNEIISRIEKEISLAIDKGEYEVDKKCRGANLDCFRVQASPTNY